MKARPNGRKGEQEAREEWTARLQRFANARTTKQKQAAIEPALKINPGGALRDMLLAWGYSASARGRKPKGAKANGQGKTARERLEETLDSLFGAKPSPVRSLYAKLAGRADLTVKDACRIVAALLATWPVPLGSPDEWDITGNAAAVSNTLIRELLSDLSGGRSRHWDMNDIAVRTFRLVDEERIGVRHFIRDASEEEGALLVAGARNILIGETPVQTIIGFYDLTKQFVKQSKKGILIFIFDAAIFEAGQEGFSLLYNIGLLSTAVTAFSLFPEKYDHKNPIQQHSVDWSAWKTLSQRCCVVIRRPTVVDSEGMLLKGSRFDDFFSEIISPIPFEKLGELKGFVRFEGTHVLPRVYPDAFNKRDDLTGKDLYWDVLIRPSVDDPEGLRVEYYIPPPQTIIASLTGQHNSDLNLDKTPHGLEKTKTIEEDLIYVIRRNSPGPYYDDAQRAIYLAARGRLGLDSDDIHMRNLNAAAALRQIGYEVVPIGLLISLFPRTLHLVAAEPSN
ncbi:MAG: hypothetical protein ACFCUR_13840 [Rhodomicrobiaceae bacterium]